MDWLSHQSWSVIVALAPAAALFARAIGRHGREPELEELPQPTS
jgi:hypothetical protein